jgi:hypothetical protein
MSEDAPDCVAIPSDAGAAASTHENGTTLRLSDFDREMGLRRQAFAEEVGGRILKLFKISVVSTVGLCVALAAIDAAFIALEIIEPSDRLVTQQVVMSIIGASIVQVGAASLAIVYSLFKQARSDGSATESESSVE